MMKCMLAIAALLAMAPGSASAQETAIVGARENDADHAIVAQAFELIGKKQAAQALETLAPLLARIDTQIAEAEAKGMVFCGPSMMEAIIYATLPATQKKDGIVLDRNVCDGLFARSYALIELDRKADALAALQRLTTLAPMHGHYFVELGFAYRVNGNNDKAEEAYRAAIQNADFAEDDAAKKRVRAMGQRGLGYILIEKGDLDGAEKAYKKSLKDDPTSTGARSELEFIAQQRKHRTKS